jgi:hypothetical protein
MLIVQDGSAHSARALSSTPTATGRAQHTIVHLAHPRHGSPALFMLVGDSVLEMRRAQRPEYSCWFVGDRCESQGDIIFGTKIDPLFLALPELEKARKKTAEHQGRFCSKEQIFAGWAESCDLAMSLSKLAAMNLEAICDVQEVADEHYYRLSDDKVKQWASSKVNAVLRFKWNDLDLGTQFTCFTGTKVQILTQLGEQRGGCK